MLKRNNLLGRVADPDNLRYAAWKAAKGKRHSREVMRWSADLDKHIADLREQILDGCVSAGNYRYFTVYEPKERRICAPAFGEQVLHHALMNVCHVYFERAQLFDSYASRKGKGTYAALERAKYFANRYTWYLKLDVRKFFESIHHEVLMRQLARLIRDKAVLSIFEQIIRSYEASPGRGLPIGNLTSQYFANHYLVGLDRFIKEKQGVPAYVRYMDDLALWHSGKGKLKSIFHDVRDYAETELLVSFKPEALNRAALGLPFLGYHIFPHHVRLLQKSKQRFIRKLRRIEEAYQNGIWDDAHCRRKAVPLVAFTAHADAKKFRELVLLRLQG